VWIIISTIVILLTVFVRIFNLYLLLALSPLAFASAMSKRTRFIFTNYIKTFLSVAVEVVMLVVVIFLFSKFFGSNEEALINPVIDAGEHPFLAFFAALSSSLSVWGGLGTTWKIVTVTGGDAPNFIGIIEYLVVLGFLFAVLVGVIKGSDKLIQKIFGIG